MRIHKLKEDRRGNSHVPIQTHIKVNTEPEREGFSGWNTGMAVEMNPENMAVDALCSWISWGGGRSILEGSGASEVGTLEESSPACHFHMHFRRMEDPPPFPLTLGDSHKNNEGSWGLFSSHPGGGRGCDQYRDMHTDSLPSASAWQNNTSSNLEKGYVKSAQEWVAFAWTLSKHRPLVTLIIFSAV